MFFPLKLPQQASPDDVLRSATEVGLLIWETQSVIALRLMGMSGMWSVRSDETARMVSEKGPAFARSAAAAMQAAASGKRPDQVMEAAVRSLRSRTRANMRRLSKRGPKVPTL
jgi:hypothetical protein